MRDGRREVRTQEEFAAALCELHRMHYRSLVGLAAVWLDEAGEDAVQDAFVRVWSGWEGIRDIDKLLVYLRRAVVNNAMSELRRRRVAKRSSSVWWTGEHGDEEEGRVVWAARVPGTEEEALRHVARESIVLRVRQLSPQQAACVALRFYMGLSEKEIADVRNISTGSVKVHMTRAMRKLEPLLGADDE